MKYSHAINDMTRLFDIDSLHSAVQLGIMTNKLDSNALLRLGQRRIDPIRVENPTYLMKYNLNRKVLWKRKSAWTQSSPLLPC